MFATSEEIEGQSYKMKLWHVVQWGNKQDGIDGHDTQCVIRSNDMLEAITKAQVHLSLLDWKDGKADVVMLLGEDSYDGDETILVILPWVNAAPNLVRNLIWYRNQFDHWVNEKDLHQEIKRK